MKYKVTVRYVDVTFTDRMEALDFADMAKAHADEEVKVVIELIKDENDVQVS